MGIHDGRGVPPDIRAVREMDFPNGRGGIVVGPTTPSRQVESLPQRRLTPGEAPFTRLVYPPRIEKLPASQDFNVQDWQVTVPAVVGAVVTPAALQFQIPASQVGWLQEMSLYVVGMTPTTLVSMAIRINGGPVPGFDNIQNSPGTANIFRDNKSELRIRLPNAALVTVAFTNVSGVAATVGGRLAGWYHPIAEEIRIFGEDGYV